MIPKNWTKKRIMETDWKISPIADSYYRFGISDPKSGNVVAMTMSLGMAENIVSDLREYGSYEPG